MRIVTRREAMRRVGGMALAAALPLGAVAKAAEAEKPWHAELRRRLLNGPVAYDRLYGRGGVITHVDNVSAFRLVSAPELAPILGFCSSVNRELFCGAEPGTLLFYGPSTHKWAGVVPVDKPWELLYHFSLNTYGWNFMTNMAGQKVKMIDKHGNTPYAERDFNLIP